jgi:hypothetical protein
MTGNAPYLRIFETLKAARAAEFKSKHGLIIKTGEGLGAAIIKLLKPSWTTDTGDEILNTNGLFFGIWVDPSSESQGRARYNLHAKKLRFLKKPDFAAREFARAFRAGLNAELRTWPNLAYPKGPITLFEGWVPLDHGTLARETSDLLDRFAAITPAIDQMLGA